MERKVYRSNSDAQNVFMVNISEGKIGGKRDTSRL